MAYLPVLLALGIPAGFLLASLKRQPRVTARTALTLGVANTFLGVCCAFIGGGTNPLWELACHLAGVTSSACYVTMIVNWRWSGPGAAAATRLITLGAITTATTVIVLFLLTRAQPGTGPISTHAHTPTGTTLIGLLVATYTTAFIVIGVYCTRQRRHATGHHRWLRAGLTTMAYSAWIGLCGPLIDGTHLAAIHTGHTIPTTVLLAGDLALLYSSPGVAVGAVLPSVGLYLRGLRARFCSARHAADLYPLWQTIVTGCPSIPLTTRPRRQLGDSLSWKMDFLRLLHGDAEWELHRRLIEIRDGYLEVRPWLDYRSEDTAHTISTLAGQRGYDLRATIEAATLMAALRARTNGAPPAGTATPDPGAPDLKGEIAWLSRVSDAVTSPLVGEILNRVEQQNASASTMPEPLDTVRLRLHTPGNPGANTTQDINARLRRPGRPTLGRHRRSE